MADKILHTSLAWCYLLLYTLLYFISLTHTQDTGNCRSRACYPQSEDLLQNLPNRTILASSTCGDPPATYDLRFAGEFADTYQSVICNSSDAQFSHTTDMLYDFSTQNIFGNIYTRPRLDTWWQSVSGQQNVAMTFSFGDSFLFQETILSFRSVRPLAMKFEKSNDFGRTWIPLHYYALSCTTYFPGVTQTSNSYNLPFCEQRYYYGDAATATDGSDIQRVEYSPAADLGQTFYQQAVMEYFGMTNLRITLTQTGITFPQPRAYFAVADLAVTGQCLCFGHARECSGSNKAECVCQHNTQGVSCQECKPLFNNRPWRAGRGNNENACEDCGCNGFATNCIYDAAKGFGVCQTCTQNTAGDKCEMCVNNFYRNPNYTDPQGANGNICIDAQVPYPCSQYCWPCGCNATGTEPGTVCNEMDGQCTCKVNVQGQMCDECKDTFHNLQAGNPAGCQPCQCNAIGSLGSTNFCDKTTGQCICKTNVMGDTCDTCKTGTFNLDINNPEGCTACECDIGGSVSGQCAGLLGSCQCRPNIQGRSCNTTTPGFFVPKLDGILYEAEMAQNNRNLVIDEVAIDTDGSDNVTSLHTGSGFLVVSPSDSVTFRGVNIPKTQRYAVYLRHKSKSTWSTISINMAPQNTDPYVCNGVTIAGNAPIGLLPGTITAAEDGGSNRFGTDTLPCLKQGLYDITITFATSTGGSTDKLLLDSLVLLPQLADIEIFTSANTPDATKQAMQDCWNAAASALNPVRNSDTCKAVEFSLMAVVYNGAISCQCQPVGTQSFSLCDSHGGQCQCQPGVIGRSCDTCTANYYGYNSGRGCTACSCDASGSVKLSCNETGGCECKTNVIGAKCNSCAAEHYGLATGNGCIPCTCQATYSLNNQCNDMGQCNCKPGVGGMNCDQCASGFYNLTVAGCTSCGCNFDGITEAGGCDNTGQCVCRPDATGEQCDMCPADTYGFGPWSERGCIKCYCSSHTNNCTAASGWLEASVVSRFSLTNTGAVSPRWTGIDVATNVSIQVNDVPRLSVVDPRIILEIADPSNLTTLFFTSPEPYHGDKRTAYGQMLTFTLSQSTTSDPMIDPTGDVFIHSKFAQQPLAAALLAPPGTGTTVYNIKLHENYWKKGTIAGTKPTMQEMIQVLAGISEIRIRAKYTSLNKQSVFFHESELQFAVDGTKPNTAATVSSVPAMFVEMCSCPPQYTGAFCEKCAPGYRWESTALGPFSGCVLCDCNGHSDQPCDAETGACQGCQHNTAGNTCEICQNGYYGDATKRTADACQPCLCPGPPGTNSFSPACDANGICLACAPGHQGNNCETCSTGFYGIPTDIQNNGGQCQACFCSRSPAQCDSLTGQCLNCIGNTGGKTCDVCDNGFWGNIASCQACNCDAIGGDGNCTQDQGICTCHPNVVGNRCTQCAPNSWGFRTGEPGCTLCDCHPIGTVFGASQCNLESGQCQCKERVTGLKCDACINGYYDVNKGCIPCQCNAQGTLASTCTNGLCSCNVTTGQCSCMLATIAGRTCDRCGRVGDELAVVEEVFVGAYPNCDPCPECYQNWRTTLLELGQNFATQEKNLMGLMSNYGSLSVAMVDATLMDIRGNLSYAEAAIQESTKEAGDLEAIKLGFEQIATSVANFTSFLTEIEAKEVQLTLAVQEITAFNGNVQVEPGVTRNAAQLQQELDSLVNTREQVYKLAETSWTNIQNMYTLVETQENQVRTLETLIEKLLDDTERAAGDRRDARSIITNAQRDTEFGENFQRLQQIDTIQKGYAVDQAMNAVTVAVASTNNANVTAQGAKNLADQKKKEAQAKAYESEVARFNATMAETAANQATTAATAYKDLALGNKQKMADNYLEVLDVNARLTDANSKQTQIGTLANQVQAVQLPPSNDMTTLVNQINTLNVNADVQAYSSDAAQGLNAMESTRNISQEAQMESASVAALRDTVEHDLTMAGTTRANTAQSIATSDGYINNINTIAQQVTLKGEQATVQGQSLSDMISEIRQDAQSNEQCLISKKNQAENAATRAQGTKMQAEAAQQEYLQSVNDENVLRNQISTAETSTTAAHNSVKAVSDSANNLYNSVITTKQMQDLTALINQYIQQRNQMNLLSNQLVEMEKNLDSIMTNLDGANAGSLRCNTNN